MSNKEKVKLRKHILKLLRNQKERERSTKSLVITDKLFKMPSFIQAKTILFYASFDGEVDTDTMVTQASQMSKNVVLPKINKETHTITPYLVRNIYTDLTEGPYGIQEPNEHKAHKVPLSDIDCVIVPGVAFDRDNYRLGRGGGYYDRFLPTLSPDTSVIGLAFDFQIVDHLPAVEQHDAPVHYVVTN